MAAALGGHDSGRLAPLTAEAAGPVETGQSGRLGSITDTSVSWPSWRELLRVLTLRDYNTRVVVIGVSGLGLAAGLIGCFMLLRERALLGDALSHATLPGIGVAFLVMSAYGASGKWLPGLLAGATVSGVLGVACILLIVHVTRTKQDAALGIVLSVFFGLGVAVTGIVQSTGSGHAAGLESFIYGKTASMLMSDALTIALAAVVIAVVCLILFKEFALLCFDPLFARSQGWPVIVLDIVMMALVVAVTVIGLQAVGLILMVALLIIPPAAARFWTNHLPTMLAASAALGALSGLVGAGLSALVPRLPAGAIIVIVSGVFFLTSLVFGSARGVLVRAIEHRRLNRKVARQNLLRAMYELSEAGQSVRQAVAWPRPWAAMTEVPLASLLSQRSWSPRQLHAVLATTEQDGLIERSGGDAYVLTPAGAQAAWRVTRNHRLWELYLITHADIAPSHVDRDADEVEHVLGPELVGRLESLLSAEYADLAVASSPHGSAPPTVAGGA